MATTQGSPILDEDLQSWYTSLNTIISNYGGGAISQLTVPGNNEKASASHVNNFLNKMTEMKADEYLGSVTSIYPTYSIVNSGTLIQSSIGTLLANATGSNYLGKIKCRNKATNANASNQNSTNANTACGSGACGSGTCSSGSNQHGTKQNSNKQNGANQHGTNQNGTNNSGCSGVFFRAFFFNGNTNCGSSFLCRTMNTSSDTFFFRGFNSNRCTSRGFCNVCIFEVCGNGTCGSGTCGSGTCGSGTCGSGTCGSGTCGSGTNQNGTNRNGTCASGTCSSGSVIDILNAHSTKSNA